MKQIIRRPLVSEKNSQLSEQGVYVFEVDQRATKPEIRNAIEKTFRVKVRSVKTAVCRGRASSRRMKAGSRSIEYWKKAMVRLAAGDKIALFEGA